MPSSAKQTPICRGSNHNTAKISSRRALQRQGVRKTAVALAVVGFVGFAIGPALFFYEKTSPNALSSKSGEALPAQAAIRGAYMNIGSKDIGPDVKK